MFKYLLELKEIDSVYLFQLVKIKIIFQYLLDYYLILIIEYFRFDFRKGIGRLCNWTPDPDGPPADEYSSFGAYQRSLTLKCEEGEPGKY